MTSRYAPLVLAGVDVIVGHDGVCRILEVNDNPVGLAACDAEGGARIVGRLASLLATAAGDAPVVLVLPDVYRMPSGPAEATRVQATNGACFDDRRIDGTLADVNALADELGRRGSRSFVMDASQGTVRGGHVVTATGEVAGAVFRRAQSLPATDLDCLVVNDLRARVVCQDKLRCASVLTAALGAVVVPTTEHRPTGGGDLVVVKPRWGDASRGVARLAPDEPAGAAEGVVWQPWVEPLSIRSAGRPYYFDLRVYVLGGEAVGVVIRRAAGPHDQPHLAASPLSWLTTAGPARRLSATPSVAADDDPLPEMLTSLLPEANDLAERAVEAVGSAASRLSAAEAAESLVSWRCTLDDIEAAPNVLVAPAGSIRARRGDDEDIDP